MARPRPLRNWRRKRVAKKVSKRLPAGWRAEPYDPELDEAPPDYTQDGLDPRESCTGAEDDDTEDDGPPRIAGAADASTRGWGAGWPKGQGANIVTIVRNDGVRLPVHKRIAKLVALLCDAAERGGYNLIVGWCWGYANRAIRGSSRPSNHSWGIAIDLNAPDHPLGRRNTGVPGFVVALFERFLFRWGGRYSGRADEMHYEFMGTPADADRLTAQAEKEIGGDGGSATDEEVEMQYVQVREDGTLFQLIGSTRVRVDGKEQIDFLTRSGLLKTKGPGKNVLVLPKRHRVWGLFAEAKR